MLSVYGDYMDGGFLEKEDYHKIISEFVNTGELLNLDDFLAKKTIKKKHKNNQLIKRMIYFFKK